MIRESSHPGITFDSNTQEGKVSANGGEARIIGTIELTTAALLIIGSVIPWASAVGAAMACGTFLLTSSFVVTTPGTFQKGSRAIPIVATLLGQFLLKDIALLAVCVTLLIASLSW